MKRALLVIALVVLGAACTNNRGEGETATSIEPPSDMPLCSELFVEGKTIEADVFDDACKTAEDSVLVPRHVSFDCADDSTLVWNDFAWGYVGRGMTMFDQNASVKMPTDAALTCLKDVGTELQGLVQERLDQLNSETADSVEELENKRIFIGASKLTD